MFHHDCNSNILWQENGICLNSSLSPNNTTTNNSNDGMYIIFEGNYGHLHQRNGYWNLMPDIGFSDASGNHPLSYHFQERLLDGFLGLRWNQRNLYKDMMKKLKNWRNSLVLEKEETSNRDTFMLLPQKRKGVPDSVNFIPIPFDSLIGMHSASQHLFGIFATNRDEHILHFSLNNVSFVSEFYSSSASSDDQRSGNDAQTPWCLFMTGSPDGQLRLYSLEIKPPNGTRNNQNDSPLLIKELGHQKTHQSCITSIVMISDWMIVTGAMDGSVKGWSIRKVTVHDQTGTAPTFQYRLILTVELSSANGMPVQLMRQCSHPPAANNDQLIHLIIVKSLSMQLYHFKSAEGTFKPHSNIYTLFNSLTSLSAFVNIDGIIEMYSTDQQGQLYKWEISMDESVPHATFRLPLLESAAKKALSSPKNDIEDCKFLNQSFSPNRTHILVSCSRSEQLKCNRGRENWKVDAASWTSPLLHCIVPSNDTVRLSRYMKRWAEDAPNRKSRTDIALSLTAHAHDRRIVVQSLNHMEQLFHKTQKSVYISFCYWVCTQLLQRCQWSDVEQKFLNSKLEEYEQTILFSYYCKILAQAKVRRRESLNLNSTPADELYREHMVLRLATWLALFHQSRCRTLRAHFFQSRRTSIPFLRHVAECVKSFLVGDEEPSTDALSSYFNHLCEYYNGGGEGAPGSSSSNQQQNGTTESQLSTPPTLNRRELLQLLHSSLYSSATSMQCNPPCFCGDRYLCVITNMSLHGHCRQGHYFARAANTLRVIDAVTTGGAYQCDECNAYLEGTSSMIHCPLCLTPILQRKRG